MSKGEDEPDGGPGSPEERPAKESLEQTPRIRKQIPLDVLDLQAKTSRADRVLRIQRWVRMGFIALIGIGALLWYLDTREQRQIPPARRPAVERVDREVLRQSTGAGARVRPMLGETKSMMLVVRSEPPGAVLTVDGVERGETPAGLDTRCEKGRPVILELEAKGFRRWRREIPCQPGLELTFEPKLSPRR